MPVVDLIPPTQIWVCQHCSCRVQTQGLGVRTPLHPCPAHANFRLPMMAEGERGDLRLHERDDYVGREDVQTDDDGRPIARAEIVHEDGSNDVWVYAPAARVEVRV